MNELIFLYSIFILILIFFILPKLDELIEAIKDKKESK
jgi:hypothetical protein